MLKTSLTVRTNDFLQTVETDSGDLPKDITNCFWICNYSHYNSLMETHTRTLNLCFLGNRFLYEIFQFSIWKPFQSRLTMTNRLLVELYTCVATTTVGVLNFRLQMYPCPAVFWNNLKASGDDFPSLLKIEVGVHI